MFRLLAALLATSLLASGCSAVSYDFMSTGSIRKTKFHDTDPQDFGRNHPDRHPVHGIDISKWNGDIDWQAVKRADVSFVFIKATEGKDMVDPAFETNWRSAAAVGLPHAPYHFYYFCSSADEQADWFIANVPKAASVLPPVVDVEWNHASKTCRTRPPASSIRAELQHFMDRLEAYYGKRPIIYTSVDFHRDNLVGSFEDRPFWVRSVAAHPEKTYQGRRWSFWQYTSTGVIPGIRGGTDINVFAGSRKDWTDWLAALNQVDAAGPTLASR
ncbi:GH25 family lysozyme [Rhizobium sp. CSW-27]|uniref:glycoside hydrolase family 25 protein n=1 Tax=Rhizobium sp. CSW-27 TaxID=2839985 RepID=UPI001C019078|nr:GH25 family lysozyme [Rhizobium sp. CSW-27]MBT9371049.1 glycoside hydrolase family 25 protein [Rhizobium sp. CSW-27]